MDTSSTERVTGLLNRLHHAYRSKSRPNHVNPKSTAIRIQSSPESASSSQESIVPPAGVSTRLDAHIRERRARTYAQTAPRVQGVHTVPRVQGVHTVPRVQGVQGVQGGGGRELPTSCLQDNQSQLEQQVANWCRTMYAHSLLKPEDDSP